MMFRMVAAQIEIANEASDITKVQGVWEPKGFL